MTPLRLPALPALAALALLASAAASGAPPRSGDAPPRGPVLLVPARADSARLEAPEPDLAPLVIPGRDTVPRPPTPAERAADWALKAEAFEQAGALVPAATAWRNALAADTTLRGAAFRMGRIYARLGDDEAAARAFAIEVVRDPGNLEAGRELGLALARGGQSGPAIQELEFLTRKAPLDDETWSALGFAYLAAGRPADGERALRRALALPPARASEHRDLGAALAARGLGREARAEYRLALAADPKDARTWLNLGNLERRGGNFDAALSAYRKAEARDSTLDAARQAQAQVLAEMGRTSEAGPAYRRWLEHAPESFGARLEALHFFIDEGRADAALDIARDAVRLDPRSPEARLLHGIALGAAKLPRDALEELRLAERLDTRGAARSRIEELVATLRAAAPDSLRALFAADSVAHAEPKAPARR